MIDAIKKQIDGNKYCPSCATWCRREAFWKHKFKLDGLRTFCKDCERRKRIGWKNSGKRGNLGVTAGQVDSMLAGQSGVCKICASPITFFSAHVDHNHSTGEIRG